MTQRPHGQKKGQHSGPAGAAAASPADAWRDWVTIWQSELNALATDREATQLWQRLVDIWARHALAAGVLLPDGSFGRAGAEPSPGPAAADAAPDAGDGGRQRAEFERLARRVEALERRLAQLGGDGKA